MFVRLLIAILVLIKEILLNRFRKFGSYCASLFHYNAIILFLFSVGRKGKCCCCSSLLHSSTSQLQHLGKRQSPIHILTADTVTSQDLQPLNFSRGWTEPMSGTMDNLGYTVTFRPNSSSVTTLRTHTGEYEFDNFHYHWGERLDVDQNIWSMGNSTI